MRYKDYEAVIEYDESDRLFFGRVINIEDIIVFDGLSVDELEQAFKTAIEQYLMDEAADATARNLSGTLVDAYFFNSFSESAGRTNRQNSQKI